MIRVQDIRSLTDFRRHTKEFIERLRQTKAPMVLTVNGEAAIVVQEAAAFEAVAERLQQLEAEVQQLKVAGLTQALEVGVAQLEAGQYTTHTPATAANLITSIQTKGRAARAQRSPIEANSSTQRAAESAADYPQ
ncbi:MAG: type II toxin-antitoxin system prevent-host-death family antitoxin [Leptolyngbyaceae cyanobacterium]